MLNTLVKASIQSNSEYSKTVTWYYVNDLNLEQKLNKNNSYKKVKL